MSTGGAGLHVLVIDDERPALDELAFLLSRDERVGEVRTCDSATEGLRILQGLGPLEQPDVVFLDVQMPGLNGLELAQLLSRFRTPPAVVFVTAHEHHAVEAFDLQAVDYVLKPVRAARLAEAVRRVVTAAAGERVGGGSDDAQVAVEPGGVTTLVRRSAITHVEAHGDYARLHVAGASHLVRTPLSVLETEWADAGFVRIHRSLLVALPHVREIRTEAGRCTVLVGGPDGPDGHGGPGGPGGTELVVSRRHTRELRDLLVRRARR